ncbi:MAG: response regulator [Desulfobacteraceae bacterium]|nr:response regulator [Desulfobacteraceae bacterium]
MGAIHNEDIKVLKLLLVDDEVGFVNILSKRLTKRGMITVKTNSGAEAIQSLRKNDFDLAVLDLKMENMSGIETLQIFKKIVPEMPVIMLTGHGCEESAKEGLASGADDYLIKPCNLEELIDKIHKVTGNKGY